MDVGEQLLSFFDTDVFALFRWLDMKNMYPEATEKEFDDAYREELVRF